MANIPEIRFEGFREPWKRHKLSECSDYRRGSFPQPYGKKEWYDGEGAMPFVQVIDVADDMKLVDDTKQKISKLAQPMSVFAEKDSVLVTLQGSIGRVAITQYEVFVDRTILIFDKYNKDIDKVFWAYIIKEKFIEEAKKAPGGTIKTITKEVLSDFDLMIPIYEEQQKLGKYLGSIDNLITLHKRKCDEISELKKYMLQKMFPKKGERFPEIRFSGFSAPWEQRKLGDVSQRVQGNDGRMDLPTLTISAGSGWLDQRDRFSANIAGKEQKNYTLLHKGELSYNHGNSKLAKYGTVFSLRTYDEALVPRVYHSFRVTDEANADFIEYMFATKLPDRELRKLISSGARMDGLLNINYDEFMSIYISMPSIEEQQCLSEYFRKLDFLITLHQCKRDNLKELKKYMFQNMFPKKG